MMKTVSSTPFLPLLTMSLCCNIVYIKFSQILLSIYKNIFYFPALLMNKALLIQW